MTAGRVGGGGAVELGQALRVAAEIADRGTQLVDQHGKPITLTPGGAWVVLVNNGTPLAR